MLSQVYHPCQTAHPMLSPEWGTLLASLQLDFEPLITTPWAWPLSQFSFHVTVCLFSPYFSMRILWERMLKALLKSE